MKLYLSFLFVFLFTACPQPNRETIIDNSNRAVVPSSNQTVSTENKPSERTVEFQVQEGRKITAQIVEREKSEIKLAVFSPSVEKTDDNLYAIAVTLLRKVYGKERGLIQLKNAQTKTVGADKYVCWQIENPSQEFCIASVDVTDTDKNIDAASFFVR